MHRVTELQGKARQVTVTCALRTYGSFKRASQRLTYRDFGASTEVLASTLSRSVLLPLYEIVLPRRRRVTDTDACWRGCALQACRCTMPISL